MMKCSSCFLIALSVLLGTVGSAKAQLITNGSFETPATTSGTYSEFHSGSMGITGWTVGGPVSVHLTNTNFTEGSGNILFFNSADGLNSVDLTGTANTGANSIFQTVTTIPGVPYELTFSVGVTGGSVNYDSPSRIEVFAGDNSLGVFTNSNVPTAGNPANWESFTVGFTALASSTTIKFVNATPTVGNGGNNFAGLDNVSLQAVPEPTSLAIFGLATLAGGGVYLRRRKQAVA